MHLARADRPVSSYDMRIKTSAGGRRWVNVSILTVESEEGPYLVHLLRDSQGTHDALEMVRGLIRLSSKDDAPGPKREDILALTPSQLEVLGLIAEGKNAREIGSELYLSQAPIRNHTRALLQAFGAHSQLELLAKARQMGII